MTTASKGLQRALARGSSQVAIAEMDAAELFAEMTDEQKASLLAQVKPNAGASAAPALKGQGDGEDYDGVNKPPKKGDPDSADASANAALSRFMAVGKALETDDSCKGKAGAAFKMLMDDDFAGLSASGLIKMLGSAPRDDAASLTEAQRAAAEAAGRADMQAALKESVNSNIDAGAAAGVTDKTAEAAGIWDKATARVFPEARK